MATKFRFNLNNQLVDFDDFYVRKDVLISTAAGNLWVWGKNYAGTLGDSTTIHRSSPVQTTAGGNNWMNISGGFNHRTGVKKDGSLWIWGYNFDGQLGDNTTISKSSPIQTIDASYNWSKVSCGYNTTAGLKKDGTLWLWGNNDRGQIGDNTIIHRSSPVQTVSGGNTWISVACGGLTSSDVFVVALKSDGTLWGWGSSAQNCTVPDGSVSNALTPIQTISEGSDWIETSISIFNAAAIKKDGSLWLWGRNIHGTLGDNTIVAKSSPVQVFIGGSTWNRISCGYNVSAATKTDGTLWLWGLNTSGQLGDNTTTNKSSPVQTIALGTNWNSISAGASFTAATKTDGTLWMWGNNSYGQLGDSTIVRKSSPVQTVAGGTNWSQVSCGQVHTAAIKTDGTLWLWGNNTFTTNGGQLGDNTTIRKSSPVQTIAGGNNWSQVSCGQLWTAAIKTDGTLWTWGMNTQGTLGDNTTIHRSSPVQTICLGNNWSKVACGIQHILALKTDGTLWSWGQNGDGQLGTGNLTSYSSPVQIATYTNNWQKIFSGLANGSSAIKTDGTLWLWGTNSNGFLGANNVPQNRSSPVQAIGFSTNWRSVAAGGYHAAGIKNDGTLWLWGNNTSAQLGEGGFALIKLGSPIQTISGGTNWKSVSCGSNFTAATKTDGTLWLWGSNINGALGDNTTISKSSPIQTVTFGNTWNKISCNSCSHIAATKTDGTLWSWGFNGYGQLGDNTFIRKSSPVQVLGNRNSWSIIDCSRTSTGAIDLLSAGNVAIPSSTPTPSLPTPYTIPGLVLYLDASVASSYPGTGTSWYSLAYIGNTATLNNGPTFNSSNGGNIVFDGVDDSATISRPVQDDFSLCCWFKSTQNAGTATQWYNGRSLMDCEVGGVVNDYGMSLGAGKVMFGTGNSDVTIVSPLTYNDGNWHFAVGTRVRSTGALTLYVDGTSVGTTTGSTNSLTSPTTMTMGGIAGSMAVAMAYNTTLSATDVTNLYNHFRSRFGV